MAIVVISCHCNFETVLSLTALTAGAKLGLGCDDRLYHTVAFIFRCNDTMSAYTPRDVYNFAGNGDSTSLTAALATSSNRSNWYTNQGGWNALHWATINGHLNCISILLNNGIDDNNKDKYSDTALSHAAGYDHLQCMELLLARGCLLYTSPSPRDRTRSRMPSSA